MRISPTSMQRPNLPTMLRLLCLHPRTTPLFPEVAVCRMESSVVVWPPYLRREKEETEFVTVTQCSFKCKRKISKQKKED